MSFVKEELYYFFPQSHCHCLGVITPSPISNANERKSIYFYCLCIKVQTSKESVSLSSVSLRQRWWPPRIRWTWPSSQWNSGTTVPTTSWNSWSVSGTTGQTSWPASTRDTTGTTASTRSKSSHPHRELLVFSFYVGLKCENTCW